MDTTIFGSFFLFLKVMLLKVFSLFIFFIFFIFQPEMLLVTLFHMIFNSSSHLNAITFMASLMPINAMLLMLSLISNPCYEEEQGSLILFVRWEHIFNTRSKDISCILSRSLNVKI